MFHSRGAGVGRAAMSRSLAMNGPPGNFIRQPNMNKCSLPGGTKGGAAVGPPAKGGAAVEPPLLVSTGGTTEITTPLNKVGDNVSYSLLSSAVFIRTCKIAGTTGKWPQIARAQHSNTFVSCNTSNTYMI